MPGDRDWYWYKKNYVQIKRVFKRVFKGNLKGDLEVDSKGEFRADFKQDLEGDLQKSLCQVNTKCQSKGPWTLGH